MKVLEVGIAAFLKYPRNLVLVDIGRFHDVQMIDVHLCVPAQGTGVSGQVRDVDLVVMETWRTNDHDEKKSLLASGIVADRMKRVMLRRKRARSN